MLNHEEQNSLIPVSDGSIQTPSNIEEIEAALFESVVKGDLDFFKESVAVIAPKIDKILQAKNIETEGTSAKDIAILVAERMTFGYFSGVKGLIAENFKADFAVYNRLKGRPSVKSLVDVGGVKESARAIVTIDEIDKALANGETYQEVFCSIIYSDAGESNLGFLCHVEEKSKTKITSGRQLLELANIDEDLAKDVEESYQDAIEFRYRSALYFAIEEGRKYSDLLTIKPEAFGLPCDDKKHLESIREIIGRRFGLNEPSYNRPSLRDIASALEAPYGEIILASQE